MTVDTDSILDWVTIGVTSLPPGWINVYRSGDGEYSTEPAPALLLEEANTRTVFWTEDADDGPLHLERTEEIDRRTRVVFATTWGEDAGGELHAVSYEPSYAYSTTEAQHALRMLELEAGRR